MSGHVHRWTRWTYSAVTGRNSRTCRGCPWVQEVPVR